MKLKVIRSVFTPTATLGKLYIDDVFYAFTLEDTERNLNGNIARKVPGQTAIDPGIYEVILSYSNRFKKYLPQLLNVKCFEGIRIHAGNTHADTEGCILVGEQSNMQDRIWNCASKMTGLISRLKAVEKKEKTFVEVVNQRGRGATVKEQSVKTFTRGDLPEKLASRAAAQSIYDFKLTREQLPSGRTVHYAQLSGTDQPKFVVGYPTTYLGNQGLFNTSLMKEFLYNPADYVKDYGFWAHFIYPTAAAESKGSFHCLNTYDRAKFTFTFMQFAVHVPDGDFVKFFKKLLQLPNAYSYFPKLVLKNDRIYYKNDKGELKQLEDSKSTAALMEYFNPDLATVETQEILCAARMVHWSQNDPVHRKIQVDTAVDHFRKNMIEYDKKFNLNGVPAKVCQFICDIRHQGRGMNDRIAAAINTGGDYDKAYKNLMLIGNTNYAERIKTVDKTISDLIKQGIFNKKYNRATNSFV